MVSATATGKKRKTDSAAQPAVDEFRRALESGRDWPTALLEAMARWTAPQESDNGRTNTYLIGGEAFDWLLLAERLCSEVDGLVQEEDREALLFQGRFPPRFHTAKIKEILGVDKYRAYLNYYYGVTVEEGLQLAVELEVQKRRLSNGLQGPDDCAEDAFLKIYGSTRRALLDAFRRSLGYALSRTMSMSESKEFTYWLFKYRVARSDKARIASDTRKGLDQLARMQRAAARAGR